MIKIQVVGDVHGKSIWKELVDLTCDKIIFLGDYVDDFPPTTDGQIISNFLDIIQFKKDNFEKVILLIGNHDEMYYTGHHNSSGYRISYASILHTIFQENKDLFQIAYQVDNYIWTHAGISQDWYNVFLKEVKILPEGNIADQLNSIFNSSDIDLITCVGRSRGGWAPHGGPIWADKSETYSYFFQALTGYHQIVGHSKVSHITKKENKVKDSSITYCDCLDYKNETYTIEI